jgi:outer membrane murein-binding lipoprotein Lpp
MNAFQVLLSPVLTALILVAAVYIFKERIDRLEAKVDRLPTREEFIALGARVDRLEREVAALRADLTQIALAVGARPRPQTG